MSKEIVLYTTSVDEAIKEIESAGGSVPLQLSEKILVGIVRDDFNTASLKFSSEKIPEDLDENTLLMIESWNEAKNKIQGKKSSRDAGVIHSWDDEGFQYPKNPQNDPHLREMLKKNGLSDVVPAATSLTMNGKIAVGVLVVSGPAANNVQFSISEYKQIVSEVLQALYYLSLSCPQAKINFFVTSFLIPITAVPTNTDCNLDSTGCENVFRNPALQYLGYSQSSQGVKDLVNSLIKTGNSNWGYVSFFTKYPLYHFAYQYGVNLYMQYSNDGWGPDKINIVFAHESCHVFGAADEYASSECTCKTSGYYNVPNNNCENCSYQPKVICLMNHNDLTICNWSRGQVGWGYWPMPFNPVKTSNSGSAYASASNTSVAYFNDNYYLAFWSNNGKGEITTGYLSDPTNSIWSLQTIANQKPKSAPSICVFNSKLYMAFRNSSDQIITAYSSDGLYWSGFQAMGSQKTSAEPYLCTFGSKLFIAFKGQSTSRLYLSYSTDGTTWNNNFQILSDQSTKAGPVMAVFNGQLFLSYMGDSNKIYISSSKDGTTWSGSTFPTIPNAVSPYAPALAVFNSTLFAAYCDKNTSTMNFISSIDGVTWQAEAAYSVPGLTTIMAPAMTSGTELFLSIIGITFNTIYFKPFSKGAV